MKMFKFLTCFGVVLIALAACEQEEALQRPSSSGLDVKPEAATKSSNPSRDFAVLDLKPTSPDRDGYQRLQTNKASGSVLYAKVQKGKVVGYLIRKRDGRKVAYVPPGQGGRCPDLYVCIHPETGKYIFYDKCVTEDPCGRPVCSDLTWCIHPETGAYLLYDKCQSDDPCQSDTPPMIVVSKKYQIKPFCPLTEYTWMIDPETGEYVLQSECDGVQQLVLGVGW